MPAKCLPSFELIGLLENKASLLPSRSGSALATKSDGPPVGSASLLIISKLPVDSNSKPMGSCDAEAFWRSFVRYDDRGEVGGWIGCSWCCCCCCGCDGGLWWLVLFVGKPKSNQGRRVGTRWTERSKKYSVNRIDPPCSEEAYCYEPPNKLCYSRINVHLRNIYKKKPRI